MQDPHYRLPTTDAEAEALASVQSLAFGGSLEDARGWMERMGRDEARVVLEGDRVAGGEFLIRMGQWFGGRSVPMVGIGGVAVDPGDRASGAATHLMQETVRELRAEGTALSTLFPAVQPLYRRAGYEQAGAYYRIRVATSRLFTRDRTLTLRRAIPADDPEIERLHREHGRENDGTLDRGAVMWRMVREPFKSTAHTFVVEGGAGLEGYVIYRSVPNDKNHQDLVCTDLVARSPGAARRLLTFFRDHGSLVDAVQWRGHPADPLLLQAREQRHEIRLWDTWMLRITHLEEAFAARGYPPATRAQVHLEIEDDVIPENAGRWILEVEGGRGAVSRGGDGTVRMDVRTLAPLYTGFATPAWLRGGHGLQCDDEDAARLAAIFAGPQPWMQDGF